jgi:Domain of unknown function (DUF4190)/Protein of unknown function (DUF2510)
MPAPPPGWYPDPRSPYERRWWSGTEWTAYTRPSYGVLGPAPSPSPTDGFAIASLITSLIGLTPVGIVLGLIAKKRIRESQGRRGGDGLATAGIAVGSVFLALGVVIVVLAVSGVFDEVNADDYSGEEARVAEVVDRFEDAYEDLDGATICRELFTGDLAGSYASSRGGCEGEWSRGQSGYAEIDIQELSVSGDGASAIADDENQSDNWVFDFRRSSGGEWRISGID